MEDVDPNDWVELLETPLNVPAAISFATAPAAGAIDLFLGITRAEVSTAGSDLSALDYQAYESMAHRQLIELAKQARSSWPIQKLVILHRIGRVSTGEPSVLIAVSTAHRAQAFDACRWIIDQLKKEVAIWKQEVWVDGNKVWVHGKIG